jgi:hypothetical protein
LTSTPQDTAGRLPQLDGYHALAERELSKLEYADSGTTLPVAYLIAHGFAAVTYAVLALRDACQDQVTDISNTLSRLADAAADTSDYAGRITFASEDTADYTGRLAYTADLPPWWRRLAWWLRPGQQDCTKP